VGKGLALNPWQIGIADEAVQAHEPLLLDLGKKKFARWQPGDEMPDDWGHEGSVCGGMVARKWENGVATYVPLLCKRWVCPVCGYYRHAWLVRNLVEAMHTHGLDKMWELTLRTTGRSVEDSFLDIQAAWGKLHDRLTRLCGHFEYWWVIETTKRGYAHMHLVVNRWIKWDLMRQLWLACTGDSDVVRVDQLKGYAAASYVAKYVGKEAGWRAGRGAVLSGRHLFGKSKGIVFDDFVSTGKGWHVVKEAWRDNAAWLRLNCRLISDAMEPRPRLVVAAPSGNDHLIKWDKMAPGDVLWRGPGYGVKPKNEKSN
jgi:hypothetical protein